MNMVAIGTVVLTSREHIIALEPLDKGLMGTLLRYPYEVRDEKEYFDEIQDVKVTKDKCRAPPSQTRGRTRIEPGRKSLLAIIASLEQAGAAFIPEDIDNGLGAGVRLRKLELEYSSMLRTAVREQGWDLIFPVRYKGQPCQVVIPIIDDIARGNFPTTDQKVKVVQTYLPQFLGAVEKRLSAVKAVPPDITLTMDDFPPGTF